MNRRAFIRQLLAAPAAASSFFWGKPFQPNLCFAQALSNQKLIVIFQRGGCDGINTVIPYGDADYYDLRPTIAIDPPGRSGQKSAIALGDGFFGLHPSLKPFLNIHERGDMAILPTVHYRNGSRSHFDSQAFIESGIRDKLKDGWLNRYLMRSRGRGDFRGASFGTGLSDALRGNISIATFSNLDDFSRVDNDLITRLYSVYDQSESANSNQKNRRLLSEHGNLMLKNLEIANDLNAAEYIPAAGAVYPQTRFGGQLRQVAHLFKSGIGLEAATVESHGWDTHAKQGGAEGIQAHLLADFAAGIEALYKDLGDSIMRDTVIMTMTEFGRTAKENASGGTDHGNASSWFVIGGSVRGGIYGDWPGLDSVKLHEGRYLAHDIEYSDVFGEIVRYNLGINEMHNILPNHNYQPVGFL